MKVKDLVKELLAMDQDAELNFQITDGCCGHYLELGTPWIDGGEFTYAGQKYYLAEIRFPALDIMSSCIASGIAHRAVEEHRSKVKTSKK